MMAKPNLLPGFISQRTRRPFKAFLVKGKDGKISFEFEERKPKVDGAKKMAKAATKTVTKAAVKKTVKKKGNV